MQGVQARVATHLGGPFCASRKRVGVPDTGRLGGNREPFRRPRYAAIPLTYERTRSAAPSAAFGLGWFGPRWAYPFRGAVMLLGRRNEWEVIDRLVGSAPAGQNRGDVV